MFWTCEAYPLFRSDGRVFSTVSYAGCIDLEPRALGHMRTCCRNSLQIPHLSHTAALGQLPRIIRFAHRIGGPAPPRQLCSARRRRHPPGRVGENRRPSRPSRRLDGQRLLSRGRQQNQRIALRVREKPADPGRVGLRAAGAVRPAP